MYTRGICSRGSLIWKVASIHLKDRKPGVFVLIFESDGAGARTAQRQRGGVVAVGSGSDYYYSCSAGRGSVVCADEMGPWNDVGVESYRNVGNSRFYARNRTGKADRRGDVQSRRVV